MNARQEMAVAPEPFQRRKVRVVFIASAAIRVL